MDLMQTLLDVAAIFITPDWAALVNLIPVFLLILVVAWFAWTIRRFATAGPTRRAPARVAPVTPVHLHMPGSSLAPIFAAVGAGALFLGLVLGGIALWLGATLLVLTLLYWGREALLDYDRLAPAERLPAVIHAGPPPGVHMPGSSIRPIMGALGSAALLGGLVVGGWVLVIAVVFLAWTLVGWLVDFSAEYRKVEEADATGHLENIPQRRLPTRSLQVFAVVFVLIGLFQLGILPPGSGTAAGGPGASPGASGGPGGATPGPAGTAVVAKDIAYDVHDLEVAADAAFSIQFRNDDAPTITHDIDIRDAGGTVVANQQPIPGGKSETYNYEPLAVGAYEFFCSVHPIPAMTGTLTVK
jgi:plastocyanin